MYRLCKKLFYSTDMKPAVLKPSATATPTANFSSGVPERNLEKSMSCNEIQSEAAQGDRFYYRRLQAAG